MPHARIPLRKSAGFPATENGITKVGKAVNEGANFPAKVLPACDVGAANMGPTTAHSRRMALREMGQELLVEISSEPAAACGRKHVQSTKPKMLQDNEGQVLDALETKELVATLVSIMPLERLEPVLHPSHQEHALDALAKETPLKIEHMPDHSDSPEKDAPVDIQSVHTTVDALTKDAPMKVQNMASVRNKEAGQRKSTLNPMLPVKKHPILTDQSSNSSKHNPLRPLKKRVPQFLLEEPVGVLERDWRGLELEH